MKVSRNAAFLVTLATVVGSNAWAADEMDVGDWEARFQLMSERMEQLEGELDETRGELDETRGELRGARDELDESRVRVDRQEQVIERAGLDRTAASGLSRFYQELEISGWVSASWLWNFNNPDESTAGSGVNQGFDGAFYPFHPDHNSFEVNQVWFELEKPVTEESRAGFRTSFVWGKTAGQLGSPSHRTGYVTDVDFAADEFSLAGGGDSASDFYLYRAYVQYLTPIGLRIRAGKFGTLLGAEVAETIYNFNITRGNVYNLLQPLVHYGVIIDGSSGPFAYSLGAVNRGACCGLDPDTNNAKSVLAQLKYQGGETWWLATSIEWGAEADGNSSGEEGRLDVLANWQPTESFSSWLDFDYVWNHANQEAFGLALAGRYAITEAAGFALRAEWVMDVNNLLGFTDPGGGPPPDDTVIWGVTGTFDYTIVENLLGRVELRWDHVDNGGAPNDQFINSSGEYTRADQIVGGLELIYQF